MARAGDIEDILFIVDFDKIYLLKTIDLNVVFDCSYNRKLCPNPSLEDDINKKWLETCNSNSNIWNGKKLRLDHYLWSDSSTKLIIHVGETDYKSYLGTNGSSHCEQLLDLGLQAYGNKQACMSDAIGVGTLLLSCDHQIILIRRSTSVGEHCGKLDIPGGHPEPEVPESKVHVLYLSFKTSSHHITGDSRNPKHHRRSWRFQCNCWRVIFFDCARSSRRVGSDGGRAVSAAPDGNHSQSSGRKQTNLRVLHSVRQKYNPETRRMLQLQQHDVLSRCSMTAKEIRQRYSLQQHAEKFESTDIITLSIDDLDSLPDDLTPSAQGSLHMFKKNWSKYELQLHAC